MNERIKELAEQAEEIVFYSPCSNRTTKQLNLEKFAELIVQECCDVIAPYTINDGVMVDVGTNLHPIYVLKQHFGVSVKLNLREQLISQFRSRCGFEIDEFDISDDRIEKVESAAFYWAIGRGMSDKDAKNFARSVIGE